MPSFSIARFSLSLDINKDKSHNKHSGKPRPVSYVEKPVSTGLPVVQEEEVRKHKHFLSPWRPGGGKVVDKDGLKAKQNVNKDTREKNALGKTDAVQHSNNVLESRFSKAGKRPVSYHGDTGQYNVVVGTSGEGEGQDIISARHTGQSTVTSQGIPHTVDKHNRPTSQMREDRSTLNKVVVLSLK